MFSQLARRLSKYSMHVAAASVSAAAMTAVCMAENTEKAYFKAPTPVEDVIASTKAHLKLPQSAQFMASMSEDNFEDEEEGDDEVETTIDEEDVLDEVAMKSVYVNTAENADLRIFCGTGNTMLSHAVASHLNVQMGRAKVHKYHDGEVAVQIFDSVRGRDCFVIQSLCGPNPHDQLMELLLLISSLRRASAGRIVAVIPYMASARQLDGPGHHRDFIPASDIAKMLETMGVDHVVAVDLHRPQVIGFFKRAVCENLDTSNSVIPYLDAIKNIKGRKVSIIAPVGGTVKRAQRIQELLSRHGVDANLAFTYLVSKRGQVGSSDDKEHHMQLERSHEDVSVVGEIAGRDVIIVDDMIDSASRVSAVADALKMQGAKKVYAYATHGLFTGNAIERIEQSALDEVIVFDTVPLSPAQQSMYVRQLSASGLIAETIKRIHTNKSTVNLEHRYAEFTS